jgi:hypothetical protein
MESECRVIKITDNSLIEIIDEITIAIGEILLRHQELKETTFYDKGIEMSKDRISKKRLEIEKLKRKVLIMNLAMKRRKEAEKNRK